MPSLTHNVDTIDLDIPGVELLGVIGRGNGGVVYKARRDGENYALKVLWQSKSEASYLGLRREAALLACLDHPGIAKLVELGELSTGPYLLMEYVNGRQLREILQTGPLAEDRVVEIATQVSSALMAAHRHNMIHQDVTPSNILMDAEGRTKLIDFGLAGVVKAQHEKGGLTGTVAYMAPEASGMLKRPIDGRTDLYSLGVVMFEALAGAPLFDAPDAGELLRLHAVVQPPDLRELRPDVSPVLAAIIAKLVAKDPDDRYQSARGLRDDLANLDRLDSKLATTVDAVLDSAGSQADGIELPIIGRRREIAATLGAWAEVLDGKGGTIVIAGEAGSGKSRLARELLNKARADGATVLTAKCVEGTSPFAPCRNFIAEYLQQVQALSDDDQSREKERLLTALDASGPMLRGQFRALDSWLYGDDAATPASLGQQMFPLVADLLLHLTRPECPLMLALDDVHWLDDSSLTVLATLGKFLAERSVAVVATTRNLDAKTEGADHTFLESMQVSRCHVITLSSLDPEMVAEVVASQLGGVPLDEESTARITTLSRGNPFAIGELVRTMLHLGLLQPTGATWKVDQRGFDELPLHGHVLDIVLHRIKPIGERAKQVLAVAAVLGTRFRFQHLHSVTGASLGEVNAIVGEASRACLLERRESGDWMFVHDQIREALLSSLSATARRDLHHRIAEVFDTEFSDDPELRYETARHYSLGWPERDVERFCQVSLIAGRKALQEYAREQAYRFLSDAYAAATGKPELVSKLEEALGMACLHTGRLGEGLTHLQNALDQANDPLHRAQLYAAQADLHMLDWDPNAAQSSLQAGFSELSSPLPRSRVALRAQTAWYRFLEFLTPRLPPRLRRVSDSERKRLMTMARLCDSSMTAYLHHRSSVVIHLAMRFRYVAHRLGSPKLLIRAYSTYSRATVFQSPNAYALRNRYESHVRESVAMAEKLNDPLLIATAKRNLGIYRGLVGDAPAVERYVGGVVREYARWLDAYFVDRSDWSRASMLIWRGYFRETLAIIEPKLPKLKREDDLSSVPRGYRSVFHSIASGCLAVLGDYKDASRHYQMAMRFADSANSEYLWMEISAALMLYHIEVGDIGAGFDSVRERVELLETTLSSTPVLFRNFHVLVAQARLAQVEEAIGEERATRMQGLRAAYRRLADVAHVPLLMCHERIISAAIARLDGDLEAGFKALLAALPLADEVDSPSCHFEILRQRALLFKAKQDPLSAGREATLALSIAQRYGWKAREARLLAEFPLQADTGGSDHRGTPTSHTAGSPRLAIKQQAALDALLHSSLAASTHTDPANLARAILDKLIELLGAERGFVFQVAEDTHALVLLAGRDSERQDLTEDVEYSQTVIHRVVQETEPIVVNASSEIAPSQSIAMQGLRSIVAAPLMIQSQLVGVISIDSRIAMGMFDHDDVAVLTALANHITFALETSRAAQLELERRDLENDLALTAVVQALLLPKTNTRHTEEFAILTYYRPMARCSGDWWWSEQRPDGRIRLFVGDVTGHGAQAAMVTAMLSATRHLLETSGESEDPKHVLAVMSDCVFKLTNGERHVAMCVIEAHPSSQHAQLLFCGAPPVLLLRDNGKVAGISVPTTFLGDPNSKIAGESIEFGRGDRLLVVTDGIIEMKGKAGERGFGLRRLRKLLQTTHNDSPETARSKLIEGINSALGDAPMEDDHTFVLIDRL